MEPATLAICIFLISFFFIITEKIPQATTAILGSAALVMFNVLDQEKAIHFIDFNTLGLLCGMMLIVAVLRKTGLFEYIAIKALKSTKGDPIKILTALAILTAVLSALLDNVTTVLIFVPISFAIADALKLNPIPFLITEILFSNIGGATTLIGDPPNIMIGGATGLNFMDFIYNLLPLGLIIGFVILKILQKIYKKELVVQAEEKKNIKHFDETKTIQNKRLLIVSLAVFTLVIIGFATCAIHHIEAASIALGGGFFLLMFSGLDPEEILIEVEWSTLFFFIGLFILVGGLEATGITANFSRKLILWTGGSFRNTLITILWSSSILSSIMDNIPYTATMISVIKSLSNVSRLNIIPMWWALSIGACFGATGSLVGSPANLVVAGFARKQGIKLLFKDYLLIGMPLMLLMILISTVYIYLRYLF